MLWRPLTLFSALRLPLLPGGGDEGRRSRAARGASARRRRVRVVFMAHRNSLQADALKLVAKKLQSSLAVEGELPEDGLAALRRRRRRPHARAGAEDRERRGG